MDFRGWSRWVRGSGLEILMIALGAALAGRFIHWVGARYRRHIDDEVREQIEKGGVVSEHAKRSRTVAQVVEWASEVVLYFLAGLLILNRAGIPFSELVAPATVAGAAIGFGARQIVQDLLAGFFLFAERQSASVTWSAWPSPARRSASLAPSRSHVAGHPAAHRSV